MKSFFFFLNPNPIIFALLYSSLAVTACTIEGTKGELISVQILLFPFWAVAMKGQMTQAFTYGETSLSSLVPSTSSSFKPLILSLRPKSQPQGPNPKIDIVPSLKAQSKSAQIPALGSRFQR